MIFADTSALFAFFNYQDKNHESAIEWFKKNRPKLIITDYIVDELLTLASSRVNKKFALTISKKLLEGKLVNIEKVNEDDFRSAWEVFDKYHDKEWSFTDCTTYMFMKRLKIAKAYAFDLHFDQFENISREPSH